MALSFAGILFLIFNSIHGGGASVTSPWGVVLLLVNSLSWQKVQASLLVVGGVVLVSTYFSRFQRFSIPRCSQ